MAQKPLKIKNFFVFFYQFLKTNSPNCEKLEKKKEEKKVTTFENR